MTYIWDRDPDREWHWDKDPLVFYAHRPGGKPEYYAVHYGYGRQVVLMRGSMCRGVELASWFTNAGTVREGLDEALKHMPFPVEVEKLSTLWGR